MIGGAEMIVAGRLRRLRKQPDRGRITADIGQGQCNAEFHRVLSNKHPSSSVSVLREDEPSH